MTCTALSKMSQKIIKDWELLSQYVDDLRNNNKVIVFTNGGFNLLHVGHIRSLTDAKCRGDILVVAVNSDSSLQAIKGEHYPIIPEDERLEVLAALECVDYLTLFSDLTVERLLLKLKPHIHAKGSDYTHETVPERDTVLSYGGKIAIVGDPKHHSTTDIIHRIKSGSS